MHWAACSLAVGMAVLSACATSDVGPASGVPASQREYLLLPTSGYPGVVNPESRSVLEAAHRELLTGEDPLAVRARAEAMLQRDPRLGPAKVLAAESDFVRQDHAAVRRRLEPVVALEPDYVAAQLLLGRAAELEGDLLAAYGAYHAIADRQPAASRRLRSLEKEAMEALEERFSGGLERLRFDEAEEALALLELYGEGEFETLDAARRLGAATDDRERELEALRALEQGYEVDRGYLQRLGMLELEVGEPKRGLDIFERLAAENPGDEGLERLVALAKFRWRLQMVPSDVQDLARRSALSRGDFATLLYWLVPNVRSGGGSSARLAADVLEHPQRDAIVRVVNLGLMRVEDDTLHRFAPDSTLSRSDALESLLRIAESFGKEVACVRDLGLVEAPTPEFTCRLAVGCDLVPSPADCLPGSPIGGEEALEMIRRTLNLFGEE